MFPCTLVEARCSALQCSAVRCSVLQCVAVYCSSQSACPLLLCCCVLLCVAVCCCVWQCIAPLGLRPCSCVAVRVAVRWDICQELCQGMTCSMLQCVAVCCSVLQCVAVCCNELDKTCAKTFVKARLVDRNTLQHTATHNPCCKGCHLVFYWLVSRSWHDWFVDVTCLIPFAWHVKGKHVSVFHDSFFYICVPWLILDVSAWHDWHDWSDNVTGLNPLCTTRKGCNGKDVCALNDSFLMSHRDMSDLSTWQDLFSMCKTQGL